MQRTSPSGSSSDDSYHWQSCEEDLLEAADLAESPTKLAELAVTPPTTVQKTGTRQAVASGSRWPGPPLDGALPVLAPPPCVTRAERQPARPHSGSHAPSSPAYGDLGFGDATQAIVDAEVDRHSASVRVPAKRPAKPPPIDTSPIQPGARRPRGVGQSASFRGARRAPPQMNRQDRMDESEVEQSLSQPREDQDSDTDTSPISARPPSPLFERARVPGAGGSNTTSMTSVFTSSNPSSARPGPPAPAPPPAQVPRKRSSEESERDAGTSAVAPRKAQKTRRRVSPREQGTSTSSGADAHVGAGAVAGHARTTATPGRAPRGHTAAQPARTPASAARPQVAPRPPPPPRPVEDAENPTYDSAGGAGWLPASVRAQRDKLRVQHTIMREQERRAAERAREPPVPAAVRDRSGTVAEPIEIDDSDADADDEAPESPTLEAQTPRRLAAAAPQRALPAVSPRLVMAVPQRALPAVSPRRPLLAPSPARLLPRETGGAAPASARLVHPVSPEVGPLPVRTGSGTSAFIASAHPAPPEAGPSSRPMVAPSISAPLLHARPAASTSRPEPVSAVELRPPPVPLPVQPTTPGKVTRTHSAPVAGVASPATPGKDPRSPQRLKAIEEALEARRLDFAHRGIPDPQTPTRTDPASPAKQPSFAAGGSARLPSLQTALAADAKGKGRAVPLPARGPVVAPAVPPAVKEYVVAYDERVQAEMSARKIPYGIQYEIAAAVSQDQFKWENVTPDMLDKLVGSYEEVGHKVRYLLKGQAAPDRAKPGELALWTQRSLEEDAQVENLGRELGLMGHWRGQDNFMGGQIEHRGKLVPSGVNGQYKIILRPAVLNKRSRLLARFLGSRRLIIISLDEVGMYSAASLGKAREVLGRRLNICGRAFVLFHVKENTAAWFIETSDAVDRRVLVDPCDQFLRSYEDVLEWCLAPSLSSNLDQKFAKFENRKNLVLSISLPVLEFKPENMQFVDDIWPEDEAAKKSTEECFTDGAGEINRAAVDAILAASGLKRHEGRPIAFQARISLSKGVWVLSLDDELNACPEPRIRISASQHKITIPDYTSNTPAARAHRIFNLLRPSTVSSPAQLNRQIIPCLANGGLDPTHLIARMQTAVDKVLSRFTSWEAPNAMFLLHKAVESVGGILGARARQLSGGQARARGHGIGLTHDEDAVDAAGVADAEPPLPTIVPPPPDVFRYVMKMIVAGFEPAACPVLFSKIKNVITTALKRQLLEYHIPLEEDSAEAMGVPDLSQILGPGEIYFNPTGMPEDVYEGEVLIWRNPLGYPSDCQKVLAVNRPELAPLHGVIVMNVRGIIVHVNHVATIVHRSLQSVLSGGDSDGDRYVVVRSPDLVSQFTNTPPICMPPQFVEAHFFKSSETAGQVFRGLVSLDDRKAREAYLASCFATFLAPSEVGLCSDAHDKSMWELGYCAEQTIYFQHMYNCLLDAQKGGLTLRPEIRARDAQWFEKRMPACLLDDELEAKQSNKKLLHRSEQVTRKEGEFVLDVLRREGDAAKDAALARYNGLPRRDSKDPHLATFSWLYEGGDLSALARTQEGMALSTVLRAEIVKTRQLVQQYSEDFSKLKQNQPLDGTKFAAAGGSPSKPRRKGSSQLNMAYDEITKRFAEIKMPMLELVRGKDFVAKMKASLAVEVSGPSSHFPFSVALHDLCCIKADAGGGEAIRRAIFERFTVAPALYRVMLAESQQEEDEAAAVAAAMAEIPT